MPENKSEILASYQDDLSLIVDAAYHSGVIAKGYFGKDPEVWMKEGESPVSEADFAVDQYLQKTLQEARPDYGWLSEESDDDYSRLKTRRTFVVDPIDGTRGFIQGMSQWCISIAIVEEGRPICGTLFCPVLEETYAAAVGQGAQLNGETITISPLHQPLQVTGPKSLLNAMKNGVKHATLSDEIEFIPFVPSLAYRIAMVANGALDVAVARGSAKDWDLAAADLILQEAGGELTSTEGEQLIYNQNDVRHGQLIAVGDKHASGLRQALLAMNE